MVNIFLGILIFGYAGWMLLRFVQKSKKGACASCPTNSSCSRKVCNEIDEEREAH